MVFLVATTRSISGRFDVLVDPEEILRVDSLRAAGAPGRRGRRTRSLSLGVVARAEPVRDDHGLVVHDPGIAGRGPPRRGARVRRSAEGRGPPVRGIARGSDDNRPVPRWRVAPRVRDAPPAPETPRGPAPPRSRASSTAAAAAESEDARRAGRAGKGQPARRPGQHTLERRVETSTARWLLE